MNRIRRFITPSLQRLTKTTPSLNHSRTTPFPTLSFQRPYSAAPKTETTNEDFSRMSKNSILLFLASGAGLLAYFVYEKDNIAKQREEQKDASYGKPKVGGPFSLVDHTGTPVSNLTYKGKYMLIYFGYTVCPEELEKMAEIVDGLKAKGYDDSTIVPIFVSCDPKRDSVKSIGEYVKDFHPKFVGLTGTFIKLTKGTHAQIKKMAKSYRLYFSAPPRAVDEDETDYLVDHSIFFYLMDPNGQYISHYGQVDSAESVRDRIIEHINQ